jgi:hypothetical protein
VVCGTFSVKRHFQANHKNFFSLSGDERHEFILRKLKQYSEQPAGFKVAFKRNNKIAAAGFHSTYCIAQHGKPLSNANF